MSKAIINYRGIVTRGKEEVTFPLEITRGANMKEFISVNGGRVIFLDRIDYIDLAPEEEYFLTTDGDGHDYCLPVILKNYWNEMWSQLYAEELEEGKQIMYGLIDKEFSQYRVEGDWDKEYKIVKR